MERLSKSSVTEQAATKRTTLEKKRAAKRLHELNNLIAKIYEDRPNEKINGRTFIMLMQKYQQEQGELETRIEALTAQHLHGIVLLSEPLSQMIPSMSIKRCGHCALFPVKSF